MKKGFTLIELIIVLAIMTIITSIAIPNFTSIKDNSKRKADDQNCEVVKRIVLMLTSDDSIVFNDNDLIKFNPKEGNGKKITGNISQDEKVVLEDALSDVKKSQVNPEHIYNISSKDNKISVKLQAN